MVLRRAATWEVSLLEITAQDTSMHMDVFSARGLESVTGSNITDIYQSDVRKIIGNLDRPRPCRRGLSQLAAVCP